MGSPIYIQIHNQIRQAIEQGKWQVGDRIPAERILAEQFGVSRMTLRQAIQTLVDEGILDRRVGAGTSQKVQDRMAGVTSFTELTRSQGKVPSSKTISYVITTPTLSERERLRLNDKAQVLRMERIRYADQVPICFEVTTVPADLVASFAREEVTTSLYEALQDRGYAIGRAQQTVSATLASDRIAEYLDTKRGAALLRLRQVTELRDGRPFEYTRNQYVGDRFEFYLENNR